MFDPNTFVFVVSLLVQAQLPALGSVPMITDIVEPASIQFALDCILPVLESPKQIPHYWHGQLLKVF